MMYIHVCVLCVYVHAYVVCVYMCVYVYVNARTRTRIRARTHTYKTQTYTTQTRTHAEKKRRQSQTDHTHRPTHPYTHKHTPKYTHTQRKEEGNRKRIIHTAQDLHSIQHVAKIPISMLLLRHNNPAKPPGSPYTRFLPVDRAPGNGQTPPWGLHNGAK
jgi:hypothetical protein